MGSGEPHDLCRICMAEVSDATSILGCLHVFCYHCVHQWTSSRRNPLCPICRAAITAFILSDGTEQAAEPSTSAPSDEADLTCLDHNYFLGEVSRLLSRANSVHNRLYAEAYGCGRKGGSRQTECCLDSIQDVLGALSSYRSSLEEEVRFDAEVLLQDLYRLDRQLTSASAGSSSSSRHLSTSAEPTVEAEAAAEAGAAGDTEHWYEEDYEEDYCWQHEDYDGHDERDWHEGLSKTPGRRPTQRNVARHTRSGSGLQQALQRSQDRGR